MIHPPNTDSTPAPPIDPRDLSYILEKTEPLWQELRGRSIYITGGTGFFGRWLVESFLAANDAFDLRAHAVVLTRSPQQLLSRAPHLAGNRNIEWLARDVRDVSFLPDEFPFVIHAETESASQPDASHPEEALSTIVEGTRRCLEFAESHKTKKFLLTSSGTVYGPQPPTMTHIPEEYGGAPDVSDPASVYGESKRMAELLCGVAAARSRMECKIARCFSFVGPHLPLDEHSAVGNFIRDAMRGNIIEIQRDGTPMRSYLYAADLAIWLWTMLFRAPSMRPFNVGSGQHLSIRSVAEAVAGAIRPAAEIRIAQYAIPGAPMQRYVPSVQAAKKILGLAEGIALQDAIQRTARWYGAGMSA